jgi:hypothetical protein
MNSPAFRDMSGNSQHKMVFGINVSAVRETAGPKENVLDTNITFSRVRGNKQTGKFDPNDEILTCVRDVPSLNIGRDADRLD